MTFTKFTVGNYELHSLDQSDCQARTFFGSLPGDIVMRTVRPSSAYAHSIVDLEHRPGYRPIVQSLQLKRLGTKLYVHDHEIFVTNDVVANVEQFLREHMVDVPAVESEKPPQEFRHFYETPFTLIGVSITRIDVTKHSPAGKFQVIGHQKTIDLPSGIDSFTLRMIAPERLEEKLQQLETAAAYTSTITLCADPQANLSKRKLLYHEHKSGWDHFVMKLNE